MSRSRSAVARPSFALAALVLFPASLARAPVVPRPPPPDDDQQEVIFAADPGEDPETGSVPIPGSNLVRGRARVSVRAPIDKVRSVLLDFPHYPEFMPHYEACRLLGRTANGGQDVYMKVGALHGAVTMWARVEVCKPHDEAGMETYDTRFVDGNVRKLESTFRIKRLDDSRTLLEFEVFLHPGIPLPSGLINQQNIDGAKSAILAYKARAEGRKPPEL